MLHLSDTGLDIIGQGQPVDLLKQCRMQLAAEAEAVGQGAAVEDRIAFAAGRHQSGLGQHLEVVAHARLADGEDLRQFQHAERIAGQCAQYVQAQRVAAGFAQGSQRIALLLADRRHG
ncbi:hypothetical protein D3C81_954870 [compost metagenome]